MVRLDQYDGSAGKALALFTSISLIDNPFLLHNDMYLSRTRKWEWPKGRNLPLHYTLCFTQVVAYVSTYRVLQNMSAFYAKNCPEMTVTTQFWVDYYFEWKINIRGNIAKQIY